MMGTNKTYRPCIHNQGLRTPHLVAAAGLPRFLTPLNSSQQSEKVSANQTKSRRCLVGSSITPERQPLRPQTTVPSAADGASHSWPQTNGCRSTDESKRIILSTFSSMRYQVCAPRGQWPQFAFAKWSPATGAHIKHHSL